LNKRGISSPLGPSSIDLTMAEGSKGGVYIGDEMWIIQQFSGVWRISRAPTGKKSPNKQLLVAYILHLMQPFTVDCTMRDGSQCRVRRLGEAAYSANSSHSPVARFVFCVNGETLSSVFQLLYGVHQGSVLRPVLIQLTYHFSRYCHI
jgi:hypothetical protein